MSETDPFAGQWTDINSVLTDTRPTETTTDKRVQRLQARAAEKRTNRHDAITAKAEQRRALREDRRAERDEARDLRERKRTERAASASRAKDRTITIGRTILVTGPILAPMAVAWTGQSQFAVIVLGWTFAASVLYAAAYELTTAYWAWLYHEARSDGDSGLGYRLGTWAFATGAAVQQWWHYSNHWHATPRAVTYSVMSGVGVLSWEGLARLVHRRKLRKEGKLPPARPRIGLARWTRYPVHSWTAWSLITLESHRTLDAAWTAADAAVRSRKEQKAVDRAARVGRRSTVRRSAGPEGAAQTVRSARSTTAAVRTTSPAPVAGPVRSGPPALTAGPVQGGPRAAVNLTKPDRRTGPAQAPATGPVQAQAQQSTGRSTQPVQPSGPDRTALALNATEQAAIDSLRSAKRSISKRSIADTVRNELGQSIASDRAAEIARHFRTLRSAA